MTCTRMQILVMTVALSLASSPLLALIEFKDGQIHDIDYVIDDNVRVDYQAPGMQTTVNWLDGASTGAGGELEACCSSRVTVSGGSIDDDLWVHGNSIVTVSGGSIARWLYAYGGQVTVSGGSIGMKLLASGTAQVTILGGSIGEGLWVWNPVSVSGGLIGGDFRVDYDGILTLHGSGFAVDGEPFGYGELTSIFSGPYEDELYRHLTGTLASGDPIANNFRIGHDSKIVLIHQPAIIYVDADATGANDGSSWVNAYNYLQDGLAAAWSGDEIWVAEGIYKPDEDSAHPNGTGSRTATFQLKNGVAIKGGYAGAGQPDPNAHDIQLYETILTGDLNGNDVDVNDPADLLGEPTRAENSYHVVTGSGTDATAILDGFIITGGNANGLYPNSVAGGMLNNLGSPTLTNCTFRSNGAYRGAGGMLNRGRTSYKVTPRLLNCTFRCNFSAKYGGGGMANKDSHATLTNCTFIRNSTADDGGGIYISNDSKLALTNCTFRGNLAGRSGGGIVGGDSTLTKCMFDRNLAGRFGGGIYVIGRPTLTDCTFSGNSASFGGGVASYFGPTLTNCRITGNAAVYYGGGLASFGYGSPTLTNCTFAGNSAPKGTALACDSLPDEPHSQLVLTNSILWDRGNEIWNNDNSTITVTYSDIQGGWHGEGNIDVDPCFADAISGDYHLKSQAGRWEPSSASWVQDAVTSPCIDAGNPMSPIGYAPFPNGGIINMGAYGGVAEASKSYFGEPVCETIVAGDINGDCKVNFKDFALMASHWLRTSFVESIFDFAVATKGALNLQGNIEIGGASIFIDASVYIESRNDPNALDIIGNSHIAGDVFIINPDATVTLHGGQASIGGETGQDAIDNHVNFGAPSTEFPVPEPNYFRHYVQNTYDPNNVLAEYDNVRIPAGTDPIFPSVTFRGIVFIEAPNVVTFAGNTTIIGIIVGNGDLNDNSGTNQITFGGTVDSYPVTDLPEEFGELRNETGTFLMAPGFSAAFIGDFQTLNGAIAANGIEFFGNAGGTIDGSVINYSGSPMTLSGNSDLFFNRSGTAHIPAGFD